MESDQSASENPTDHHDTGGTGNSSGAVSGTASNQVRSYECTFCKRGFSNAQALGGHMNIHRKDKAKLKQPPNSSVLISNIQQYSDDQKTFPFWPPPVVDKTAAGDEIRSTVPRQLPLLPEKPYGETQKPSEIHQVHGEAVEKSLSSDQASSPELDLELRLGPEPQDSSAATGTRKFF